METAAIAFLKQNDISYSTMEYPENGPIAAKDVAPISTLVMKPTACSKHWSHLTAKAVTMYFAYPQKKS